MTSHTISKRHGSATVTIVSDTEFRISRKFDAPASLIFSAWTTPRHVRRWWCFDGVPMTVCDIDLRVGGDWRYVIRDADGRQSGWHGTYLEIEAPYRLVSTEVFEGYPHGESVNTMTLDEVDGVTTMNTLVTHSSKANRDGHLESGMESGMQVVMNQIEDLLPELDEEAERFRRVAWQFTRVARAVPDDAWGNPAPPEGWVARDVVRHLVEWVPSLFANAAGIEVPEGPSVDSDPVGAWLNLSDAFQNVLDDPSSADRRFSHPMAGDHALPDAIDMFVTGDVLMHTWDLARATGGDERLDPVEVHRMLVGMLPLDEMLRASGQYGPRVAVPEDADEQTQLLAFIGRTP